MLTNIKRLVDVTDRNKHSVINIGFVDTDPRQTNHLKYVRIGSRNTITPYDHDYCGVRLLEQGKLSRTYYDIIKYSEDPDRYSLARHKQAPVALFYRSVGFRLCVSTKRKQNERH